MKLDRSPYLRAIEQHEIFVAELRKSFTQFRRSTDGDSRKL